MATNLLINCRCPRSWPNPGHSPLTVIWLGSCLPEGPFVYVTSDTGTLSRLQTQEGFSPSTAAKHHACVLFFPRELAPGLGPHGQLHVYQQQDVRQRHHQGAEGPGEWHTWSDEYLFLYLLTCSCWLFLSNQPNLGCWDGKVCFQFGEENNLQDEFTKNNIQR